MNKISPKRKAMTKLRHNSTFGVLRSKARTPQGSALIERLLGEGKISKANAMGNGKSEKAKWKAKAWKQFSLFVRLRDADANGIVKCCTCGSRKPWKRVQAGHYVTRAKEATLFDEQCVQGQCAGCNMWQGGKPLEFEQHLERRYGRGTAEGLRIKALQPCKRRVEDYQRIEAQYRSLVAMEKANNPGKFTEA